MSRNSRLRDTIFYNYVMQTCSAMLDCFAILVSQFFYLKQSTLVSLVSGQLRLSHCQKRDATYLSENRTISVFWRPSLFDLQELEEEKIFR